MRRIDPAAISMAPLWQAIEPRTAHAGAAESVDGRRDEELASARELGYREGHALGMKRAQDEVARANEAWRTDQERSLSQAKGQADEARQRFDRLAAGLSAELQRLEGLVEETAVSVAFAAVARCLGDGYVEGGTIRALVRSAIAQAGHPVESVRLAEVDVGLVGVLDPVVVVGDPRLTAGQCVLETRYGHYESGLDVRLESLKQALLSGLARHRETGAER